MANLRIALTLVILTLGTIVNSATGVFAEGLKMDAGPHEIGARIVVKADPGEAPDFTEYGHIQLFADGEAIKGTLQWARNDPDEGYSVVLPSRPGIYELRFYDRHVWKKDKQLIDSRTFEVVATQDPEALKILEKSEFEIGSKITVRATPGNNRYLTEYAHIEFFKDGLSVPKHSHQWFGDRGTGAAKEFVFTAPIRPGTYEVRFYDRHFWERDAKHLIDSEMIEIVATQDEAALDIIDGPVFSAGEPIRVRVNPGTRRFVDDHGFVGLYPAGMSPDERAAMGRMWVESFCCGKDEKPPREITMPRHLLPGCYEFRLYDRSASDNPHMIDADPFEVRTTATDPTCTETLVVEALGADGTVLTSVAPGELFRLRAVFDVAQTEAELIATLLNARGSTPEQQRIVLNRGEDWRYFQSGLLRLKISSWSTTNDGLEGLPGKPLDANHDLLTSQFTGLWTITAADGTRLGEGRIEAGATGLTMRLGEGDAQKTYKTAERDTHVTSFEGMTRMRLRFALADGGTLDPEHASKTDAKEISVLPGQSSISFEIAGKSLGLDLALPAEKTLDDFKLQLTKSNEASRLTALFSANGVLSDAERIETQTWIRSVTPKIRQVIKLDNDAADATVGPNYVYPYDSRYGETGGLTYRTIVILGEDLPEPGEAIIVSTDDAISYSAVPTDNVDSKDLRQVAYDKLGEAAEDHEDWMVLRATLAEEVTSGAKRLALNGVPLHWTLGFADNVADISFLRDDASPGDAKEATFYAGEVISLGLKTSNPGLPIEHVVLKLEGIKPASGDEGEEEVRLIEHFKLTPGTKGTNRTALSEKFLIALAGDERQSGSPRIGKVELWIGERLRASVSDPAVLAAIPAEAEILGEPRRKTLWDEALEKVAACHGDPANPLRANYAADPSYTLEKRLFVEGLFHENGKWSRSVSVSNGDHAALILVKNEMIPIMRQAENELARYNQKDRVLRALAYLGDAKQVPGALSGTFWQYHNGNFFEEPVGRRMPSTSVDFTLSEAADIPALRDKFNRALDKSYNFRVRMNIEKTRELALTAIADALEKQSAATKATLERAESEDIDCNVAELIIFAGQGPANGAVSRILPDLVRPAGNGWTPDGLARGYVKGAHIAAAAVLGLEDYAAADDAVISTALGAAGGGAVMAGRALANAKRLAALAKLGQGAVYTGMAVEFGEAAVFGSKLVKRAAETADAYETALGQSSVMDIDTIRDAEERLESIPMAIAGVVLPATQGVGTAARLAKARQVSKGRDLVQAGRLDRLEDLSDAEKRQVQHYHDHLRRADRLQGGNLLPQDRADLDALNGIADQRVAAQKQASAGSGTAQVAGEDVTVPVPANAGPTPAAKPKNGGFSGKLNGGDKKPALAAANDTNDATVAAFRLATPDGSYAKQVNRRILDGPRENVTIGGNFETRKGRVLLGNNPVIQSDSGEVLLGRRLDGGSFSELFEPLNPGNKRLFKIRRLPEEREVFDPDIYRDALFDSEVSRKLLSDAVRGKSHFRLAERYGDARHVKSADGRATYWVTEVEDIRSPVYRADGTVIKSDTGQEVLVANYKDRLAARSGLPETPASRDQLLREQATLRLAMDELHSKGIYWTDAKTANFDIVRDDLAPTGYRVKFFDYDGFRKIRLPEHGPDGRAWTQKTAAAARQQLANRAQTFIDTRLINPDGKVTANILHSSEGKAAYWDVTDWRLYDDEMLSPPLSLSATKLPEQYWELTNLPPNLLRASIKRLFPKLGSASGGS